MTLLHKLRLVGIEGKLLNTIKGMYDAPKIAVRVGNEVYKPTEYLFGVLQGCPASPILFDFYINDIFKGVRGVRVPGLTSRIPGLLFADDAVLLAESSADLQIALNTINEWSDTWEMAVNASKCGIMTISGELSTDMTLQGQKVDSTDQYTYLGYIMNSKWDISGTINNNKNKVRKAVYASYSFLRRSDVLKALKIKFINSVLMPMGCYGGETFGMSEARCKPIHLKIDKAIRLVVNVGKSAAMERIRDELGISSVFMRTSTARERAYHKWPTSKTWIADLIKAPMKARMAIWVTGSARWIKKFCSQDSNGQTKITIVDRKRRNIRSVIRRWTVNRKIGKKGNWVDLQAMYPDLKLGLQDIGKMRMGTFRTAQRLSNMKIVDQKFKNFCPCCNLCVPETVEHILLSFSRWLNHRTTTIGRFIPTPIRSDEKNLISNFNEARLGLVGKLLGGESKQSLSQLRAGTADQNFELETDKFLNGIRVPRTLILQSISDSPAPLN
ncbi:RNA-directed DNA polymerase from mobile element jockey [Smittium culicis]|uniref:RNA-directed DNA polymerase from mobile element jockey n=1 Tax=Smittium culicis TaxID=133412 RepID=A0A1R1XJH9_9FUNG|nr:RNA-directed DNA polymerase from mobile element jockey [Smittium culicis]